MKKYPLTGPVFDEISELMKEGPGEGRYAKVRDLIYGVVGKDYEVPKTPGLSVKPKSNHPGVYEMEFGNFTKLSVELNLPEHDLLVKEGLEKKKL